MKSIYVIDDDEVIGVIFERLFREQQDIFKIKRFTTANSAMETIDADKPEMVFLDYHLPEMTGRSALMQIKKINPDQKVVMITNNEDPDVKEKLFESGADGFISKQYDDFKEVVDEMLAS